MLIPLGNRDLQMKHRLELELDIIIDESPLKLASKVEQAVREAVEVVKQSLSTELAFDIFRLMVGRFVL